MLLSALKLLPELKLQKCYLQSEKTIADSLADYKLDKGLSDCSVPSVRPVFMSKAVFLEGGHGK